jgi:hypothetical protein
MTTPERPVGEVDWETIQRVADKGEVSRLESLSSEELERELRAAGIDPEDADRMVQEALAKTADSKTSSNGAKLQAVEGAGGKAPARAGRSRPAWAKASLWAAATAAAAGVLFRVLAPASDVVGSPTKVQEAETLRDQAAVACGKQAWVECEQKLNEARAIDPGGEGDPRVVEERKAIAGYRR